MKYLIGIDFGTTTTAISCTRISATFEPELIEIDNQRTTESVIRLTDENEIEIIGLRAWEEIGDAPERTFYEFKLKVASKDILQLPEGPGTARDIGIIFLRNLREKIERGLFGNSPLKEIDAKEGIKTVIGHPSGWSEAQRKATISMAEEAGFPNVEGCEEPIGALYYHYYLGDLSLDKVQKVLVYDFGGGTSDVAIISTTGAEEPRVIATSGIADLGGRNFDEIIASAWEEKLLQETYKTKMSNRDRAWVRRHSRRLKEKLSIAVEGKGNSASETIPILQCKGDRDTFSMDVTSFETMNADLITRFSEPLWDALSGASLGASDIDIVILTGGSGRFYFAREKLKEMFPNAQILRSANPQEAVSKGLALYSKVLVCGKEQIRATSESSDQAVIKTPYGNKSNSSSSDEAYPMLPDPYTKFKKNYQKKAISKLVLWGGAAVAIILIGFLTFGGEKDASIAKTSGTTSPAPAKSASKEEKSLAALRDIEIIYTNLVSAQRDRNISMVTAIKDDLKNINVSDTIPEVAIVRSALTAWINGSIDFHSRHGLHPYNSKKIWPMPTTKEVDGLKNQGFLNDTASIDAFSIDSDENHFLFALDKAYIALRKKSRYKITKTSMNLEYFDIDEETLKKTTNYNDGIGWGTALAVGGAVTILTGGLGGAVAAGGASALMEGAPDVKIVLALKENSKFIPVKMYPSEKRAYEDTLRASINDSFTWYTKEGQSLYVFMLDIDDTNGELLDYVALPSKIDSNWINVGSGCRIKMSISTENT